MNNILVLFACVAAVTCNDIEVGSNYGRIIFDEKIQASPAIWRQVQKITINASDYEVISRVVVTDQRAEKDGGAKIVEGGEGQKNVTIELQSPTVFRGFDFHVVIYAVQEKDAQNPVLISKDTDVNTSNNPENKDSVTFKDTNPTVPIVEGKPITNEGDKPSAPVTIADQTRKYRDTQEPTVFDPIVQYVNEEKTTEVTANEGKAITPGTQKVNAPEEFIFSTEKVSAPVTFSSTPASVAEANNENQTLTEKDKTDNSSVLFKDVPQIKDVDVKINKDVSTTTAFASTGASDITGSSTTENIRDQTQHNFDNISKELGQKVLFGVKKH